MSIRPDKGFMQLTMATHSGMAVEQFREYAYDRQSSVGRLDKALDDANATGWTVVDMKIDWKVIFPPE